MLLRAGTNLTEFIVSKEAHASRVLQQGRVVVPAAHLLEVHVQDLLNQHRHIPILVVIHAELAMLVVSPAVDEGLALVNGGVERVLALVHLESLRQSVPGRSNNYVVVLAC